MLRLLSRRHSCHQCNCVKTTIFIETAHNAINRQPLAVSSYNTILASINRTTCARLYGVKQKRNKRAHKCKDERNNNTAGLITQTRIFLSQTTAQTLKPPDSQKLTHPPPPHKRQKRAWILPVTCLSNSKSRFFFFHQSFTQKWARAI